MKALAVSLLGSAAVLCFVFAWLSNARDTRELNRLGTIYNCKRWPEEDNRSYRLRLRARAGDWRSS